MIPRILLILIPLKGKRISRRDLISIDDSITTISISRRDSISIEQSITTHFLSRKGFNINRLVALYHYARGACVACAGENICAAASKTGNNVQINIINLIIIFYIFAHWI